MPIFTDNVRKSPTKDQVITLFNTQPMSATISQIAVVDDTVYQGSILCTTDSTFNGSTSTLTIYISNDNVTYAQGYADDDVTPLTFTLAASSTYSFPLKRILFKYYKLTYTVGNASAGVLNATYVGKKV